MSSAAPSLQALVALFVDRDVGVTLVVILGAVLAQRQHLMVLREGNVGTSMEDVCEGVRGRMMVWIDSFLGQPTRPRERGV